MRIEKQTLSAVTGRPASVFTDEFMDALHATLARYNINSPLRVAHFLAQVAHESGGFRWPRELWGPTEAQKRYEGRADLGNTEEGDGFRFRGRGYIQLTGRANYRQYSVARGVDFVAEPDLVAELPWAMDVAGWFWETRSLNGLADADAARSITEKINGGTNGLADRMRILAIAKALLTVGKIEPHAPVVIEVEPPRMELRKSAMPEATVFDSKPLWASKRFWGIVVTTVGAFGGSAPVLGAIVQHYDAIVTVAGLLLSLYGSVVANKRLRLWPEKKG